MNIDIGAKRPIEGNQVFLVGRYILASDPPFILLYDATKGKESKRNLRNTAPEKVVAELGGSKHFTSIIIPTWGTAWFRASRIRKVIEMSSIHLQLSSDAKFGAIVLFDHDPEPSNEAFVPNVGFSLYGFTVEQVEKLLECE